MNVFYSTSSITSYIISFILIDCFENLTFTLHPNHTRIEYPRGVRSLSFLRAWEPQFLVNFVPFSLGARITGTAVAVFENKRKEIKRKDKCMYDKEIFEAVSAHVYTRGYFRYTIMYLIIIMFCYTMEI